MTARGAFLLACLLAAPPLFAGLGRQPLVDPDEGRYAWAARVMARDGLSITPVFNDEPRFAKPAPLTWLQALAMRALGESELALRLPCALLALGAVVLVARTGDRAAGAAAGLVAALVLGTGLRFVAIGRQALVDAPLVFAMTGTLGELSGLVAARETTARAGHLARAHLWMALGALAKGPVALVLPWLALLAHALVTRSFEPLRGSRPARALGLFLLVSLPYYLAMLARHGRGWLEEVLVRQHVKRALGVGFFQPSARGPSYFLKVVPGDVMPWTPIVLVGLVLLARRFTTLEPELRARVRFLLVWTVVVVAFFSVPTFKLPHYVLPAYPALALVTGIALTLPELGPRVVARASAVALGLLAAAATLAWAYASGFGVAALPLLVGGVLAALAALVLVLRPVRALHALLVLGVLSSGIEAAIAGQVLPALAERFRPERELALRVPSSPGSRVATYGLVSSAFVYYAGRRVEMLTGDEELARFLEGGEKATVLATSPLHPMLASRVERTIAVGHTLEPRIGDLWSARPPRELALVETGK